MSTSYALNNFNKAVRMLGEAGFRKRDWLSCGYVECLCRLELADLPDPLKNQFAQFRLEMQFIRAECKAGTLKSTVDSMDDGKVDEMVARILGMHEAIVQLA